MQRGVLHGDGAVGLLTGCIPDLHADLPGVVELEGLGGEFDGHGGHDVGGGLIAHEGVGDVGLARGSIAHQDYCDSLRFTLLEILHVLLFGLHLISNY
jgi:hypothetical protein